MEKDSDSFVPTAQSSKGIPLTGPLCETTYLKLNDPSTEFDANFIECKHQQQKVRCLPSQSDQTAQLVSSNSYKMEVMPSNVSPYGSSVKATQRVHFLRGDNDFVAVTCLDILQGQ